MSSDFWRERETHEHAHPSSWLPLSHFLNCYLLWYHPDHAYITTSPHSTYPEAARSVHGDSEICEKDQVERPLRSRPQRYIEISIPRIPRGRTSRVSSTTQGIRSKYPIHHAVPSFSATTTRRDEPRRSSQRPDRTADLSQSFLVASHLVQIRLFSLHPLFIFPDGSSSSGIRWTRASTCITGPAVLAQTSEASTRGRGAGR